MSQLMTLPPKKRSAVDCGDRLRIAVFTYSYFPTMTGISTLVHERIACLLRQNHTVRLFYPQILKGDESVSEGVSGLQELQSLGRFSSVAFPSVPNPLRRSFPEAASWRVWDDTELLRDFTPDVITVDEAAGLYGASSGWLCGYRRPIGVRYAKQFDVPCVNLLQTDWQGYMEHFTGRLPFRLLLPAVRMAMKPVAAGYDANLTPSVYLRNQNRAVYKDRVEHLAFHGVDCDRFTPANSRFGRPVEDTSPLILSTCRIAPEKNVWRLLEAFKHVLTEMPMARLAILGRGPLLPRLRKEVPNFGNRLLLPGAVFGDDLKAWYARADVYWTASKTENFSAGILESLASSTPVIAAAAGGNVEQVVNGVSGHLVRVNDSQEMARRTTELLRNPEQLAAMSIAAREQAIVLSLEPATDRLVTFLRELIAGKHKRTFDSVAISSSYSKDKIAFSVH